MFNIVFKAHVNLRVVLWFVIGISASFISAFCSTSYIFSSKFFVVSKNHCIFVTDLGRNPELYALACYFALYRKDVGNLIWNSSI